MHKVTRNISNGVMYLCIKALTVVYLVRSIQCLITLHDMHTDVSQVI